MGNKPLGFQNQEGKNKFEIIERQFLDNLRKIHDDISESIKVLGKNSPPLIKSQLCMAFICADTFSRTFWILKGAEISQLDSDISQRFRSWLENFVFTDKNEIYKSHKGEIRCNADLAWKLRCALLHFYGLPSSEQTNNMQVGWFNGSKEQIDSIEEKFENLNRNVKLISQSRLIQAILWGLLAQLNFMRNMIEKSPSQYVERIKIANEILQNEGAVTISMNKK